MSPGRNRPCPACRAEQFSLLAEFGEIPLSGTYLDKTEQSFTTVQVAFDFCRRCGLLRQRRGKGENPAIDSHVDRPTVRPLPDYIEAVVYRLRHAEIGPEDLVIVIGLTNDVFLAHLKKEGFKNVVVVEPSALDAARKKNGPARAVLCMHTLERIPDPAAFAREMRDSLTEGGVLFVEVPGSGKILSDFRIHELCEESLHIFSERNFPLLLEDAGFHVESSDIPQFQENVILFINEIEKKDPSYRIQRSSQRRGERPISRFAGVYGLLFRAFL